MPLEVSNHGERQSPSGDLTKSQVNRLGDRLRKGHIKEQDRRLLDKYGTLSLRLMRWWLGRFEIG